MDHFNEFSFYEKDVFQKFLERSENNEVIANIKDAIKLILYDNRKHIPKPPRKKLIRIADAPNIDDNIIDEFIEPIEKKPTKNNKK